MISSSRAENLAHCPCRSILGHFVLLLVAAVLVELRTAFRLAESSQGVYSYLSTHEVFFGTLEFLPIVLAVIGLVFLGWATRQLAMQPVSANASVGFHGQQHASFTQEPAGTAV